MPDGRSQYSISSISKIIQGNIIPDGDPTVIISDLLYDSRLLLSPQHTLFFALSGQRNDGHKYIHDLHSKGLRNFVVSSKADIHDKLTGSNIISVNNPLEALQDLCAYHRSQFNYPVVGITGSNGKTVVKEWLYQLMGGYKNIVINPKSYNSQIGVPVSVWQMNNLYDLAIFEAGISRPGEMEKLQTIIKPDVGIFTNIGQAHDENFQDTVQKINEKLRLFTGVDTLIYSSDQTLVEEQIKKDPVFDNMRFFTWGKNPKNDLVIQSVKKRTKTSYIQGLYNGVEIAIEIPFTDNASIENAIHCWATMLFFDFGNDIITKQMLLLTPVAMRLELKEGINHCSVINDSYSLDVKSLNIALDFLEQQKHHKKKTVILSDFKQSGRQMDELYREVSGLIKNKNVSRLIGIGPNITKHQHYFDLDKTFYQDTDSFLNDVSINTFDNETILLKGARVFGFEKISNLLQQKAHETILEINLDALIHNLNFYRSQLDHSTKIMAMVKAFSYGSGSFEIANILQYHHVDYLAVAYADEGIELRNAGIRIPIMVMNPDRESMDAIIKFRLEPEIYNLRILGLLENTLKEYNGSITHPLPIHIKVDTGMHRLGFEENDIPDLINRIKNTDHLIIRSVFSHLAASEDPDHDDFTRRQIKRFRIMSEMIKLEHDHYILSHILNSAGIIRFPEAHFDMVRLGISLYGLAADQVEQKQLQNVSSLRSTISQIKKVPAYESIGYNRQWISDTDITIAIIPIGYADGLSRILSNGRGRIFINGHLAPIVGNVCMDMCMIDITGIEASEGDEVTIFGNEYSIFQLAKDMGTIPYEILTGLSRRVKRVYYQE